MADPIPSPDAASSAAAARPQPSWSRRLAVVVAVVLGITGAFMLVNGLTLPGCGAERTLDALKAIYKDSSNIEITALKDIKSLTDTATEKTCEAQAETATVNATLAYTIFWDGWSAKIMVTQANAQPK